MDVENVTVTWCLQNFEACEFTKVRKSDIWDAYQAAFTNPEAKLKDLAFSRLLRTLFPLKSTRVVDRKTGEVLRCYHGMKVRVVESTAAQLLPIAHIAQLLPSNVVQYPTESPNVLQFGLPTNLLCNGNPVMKKVTLSDIEWSLQIRNKDIPLSSLCISKQFRPTKYDAEVVLQTVSKIKLCKGVAIDRNTVCESTQVISELYSTTDGSESEEYLMRSIKCLQVLEWSPVAYACYKCKCAVSKVLRDLRAEEETSESEEESDVDMDELLAKGFPNASEEMKTLLQSQHDALACKNPKCRRWDPKIIQVCLKMWMTSGRAYKVLQNSQMLVLPSERTLAYYKDCVPQGRAVNGESSELPCPKEKDDGDEDTEHQPGPSSMPQSEHHPNGVSDTDSIGEQQGQANMTDSPKQGKRKRFHKESQETGKELK